MSAPKAVVKITKVAKQPKAKKAKKLALKFTIDCSHPVEDGIFDMASFVS